jgi:hypothetical protein
MTVLVGDLGQRGIQDRDVISGRVRSRVAGSKDPGQGFVGVVQEHQDRVVAEPCAAASRRAWSEASGCWLK